MKLCLKTSISFHKNLLPHHRLILIPNSLLAKRQAFNDSFQSHFNVYLMRKKLRYFPSSIITHKNLSTTPFITCNTCYSFSCLPLNPTHRLRVCVRREYVVAWYSLLHSLYFDMSQCMRFPTMWHFDMCRLRLASAASF